MKTVRNNVFETNSSSVHSLVICSGSDYDKFVDGELLYDNCSESLVDIDTMYKDYIEICEDYNDDVVSRERFGEIVKRHVERSNDENSTHWDYEEDDDGELPESEQHAYEFLRDYQTINSLGNNEYETFTERRTINGTEVVAFGYYGHD